MRLIIKNQRVNPLAVVSFIMLAMVLMRPVDVLAKNNSLDDYVGVWLVEYKKTNIFFGEHSGRGESDLWEIRESEGKYELSIPNKQLIFKNISLKNSRLSDNLLVNITDNSEAPTTASYSVDIVMAKNKFQGKIEGSNFGTENVYGRRPDSYKDNRDAIKRLQNYENETKTQIAGLRNEIKTLETAKKTLVTAKDDLKLDVQDLNKKLSQAQQNLKTEKLRTKKAIAKISKVVPKIDTRSFGVTHEILFETALQSRPQRKARTYMKLKQGQQLVNFGEPEGNAREKWALVSTDKGNLGYVRVADMKRLRTRSVIRKPATKPLSKPKRGSPRLKETAITILEPAWDVGAENIRMTIDAAGFITLVGRINVGQPLKTLLINQEPVHVSDKTFEYDFKVTQSQRIDIIATLLDGKSEKLSFDLKVSP